MRMYFLHGEVLEPEFRKLVRGAFLPGGIEAEVLRAEMNLQP